MKPSVAGRVASAASVVIAAAVAALCGLGFPFLFLPPLAAVLLAVLLVRIARRARAWAWPLLAVAGGLAVAGAAWAVNRTWHAEVLDTLRDQQVGPNGKAQHLMMITSVLLAVVAAAALALIGARGSVRRAFLWYVWSFVWVALITFFWSLPYELPYAAAAIAVIPPLFLAVLSYAVAVSAAGPEDVTRKRWARVLLWRRRPLEAPAVKQAAKPGRRRWRLLMWVLAVAAAVAVATVAVWRITSASETAQSCVRAGVAEDFVDAAPAISGNIVVWSEERRGTDLNMAIYGCDLAAQRVFPICTRPGPHAFPAISGKTAVWTGPGRGGSNAGCDIYGYDIFTRREFPICTEQHAQGLPVISGNVVVWMDWRNEEDSGCDIYGYDISTRQEFPVCTAAGDQQVPAISGTIVVWMDDRSQAWTRSDIYAKDLATGREFAVCNGAGAQARPAISGNIVVWEDDRNTAPDKESLSLSDANVDIYGKDLRSGKEFAVCTERHLQSAPAVCGDIVVWTDMRNSPPEVVPPFYCSNADIYGKELAAGREFPICTAPGDQQWPAIYGNVVIAMDARKASGNNQWSVYQYRLRRGTR